MDDMITAMSKKIIEKAMKRVVFCFEYSIKRHNDIEASDLAGLTKLARLNATESPCGLMITVKTRRSELTAEQHLNRIVRLVEGMGVVRPKRIKQFHFERISDPAELISVCVLALDDA